MADTSLAGSPAELERRVEARIGQIPAAHMTAMQTMASFMWLPMMIMGVMVCSAPARLSPASTHFVWMSSSDSTNRASARPRA